MSGWIRRSREPLVSHDGRFTLTSSCAKLPYTLVDSGVGRTYQLRTLREVRDRVRMNRHETRNDGPIIVRRSRHDEGGCSFCTRARTYDRVLVIHGNRLRVRLCPSCQRELKAFTTIG